jgi:hypothetical protein
MMVPKKSLILAGAALAMLGASSSAQSQSGKVFARYTKPLSSVSLDLATGTITHGPAVNDRAATTVVDFANNDLGGFVGVDTGGGACEWIDAGTKGNVSGNASDLMNNVVFAYCSAKLTPASGGVGGSVQLGFYEGYTVGGPGPVPSTGVGLFNLTGLPGNTASSSFVNQGFRCFFINLTFANLVAFADGNIGYSWQFTDLGTTGLYAATFPFLSCVQSCSGTGPDGQGMVDLVDQYCPPGSLTATFSFGTTPQGSYFTSISMDVREAADVEAVATSWNSQGINVDSLSSNAITVGGSWTLAVTVNDVHAAGATQPMSYKIRANCINGANANSPLGGRPVELLTSGAIALAGVGTHGPVGGTYAFPSVPIAASIDYVCLQWSVQATVVGGGFADLTNARCGQVGSVDLVPDP